MFGRIRAAREKRRSTREKKALQAEIDRMKKDQKMNPLEEHQSHQSQVNQIAQEQKEKDKIAAQEGRTRIEDLFAKGYKGLEDQQRRVLQESADNQINRDIQGYEKKLLAQHGRRGIKGGTAFAQQLDLARLGEDAQQQMQRDLSVLDADLVMKKIASIYNAEQGEVAQEGLRQQMARDVLTSYDQKKYQKYLAEQANKLFQRV